MKNLFMKKLGAIFIIFLIACTGCVHPVQVQRLPAYDIAITMGGPDRPKLFYENTVKINSALTPYAVLIMQYSGGNDIKKYASRNIWKKAAELKADIVIIRDGSTQYIGTTSAAFPLGYGGAVAFGIPMYQTALYGYCFKLNPAKLGFIYDKAYMITEIINENLREAGLLEGDKLILLNGIEYDPDNPERLRLKYGEEATISVVRPGTGKIDVKIKLMENIPTYLDYTDAIPWEDPLVIDNSP